MLKSSIKSNNNRVIVSSDNFSSKSKITSSLSSLSSTNNNILNNDQTGNKDKTNANSNKYYPKNLLSFQLKENRIQ